MIDISRPIHPDMAVYPDNPSVQFEQISAAGPTSYAVTRITLGAHTGTHIDAPSHIVGGGAGTDSYDLEQLNGPVQVLDLPDVTSMIRAQDLAGTGKGWSAGERLLFKTLNSLGNIEKFDDDFVAIDESTATALVAGGIRLVGIDALSIKKKGVRDRVHHILLEAGVVILEGLWLAGVQPGHYELLCLPLSVQGIDGAPVRAALR